MMRVLVAVVAVAGCLSACAKQRVTYEYDPNTVTFTSTADSPPTPVPAPTAAPPRYQDPGVAAAAEAAAAVPPAAVGPSAAPARRPSAWVRPDPR
jgi:hypothetical protein